MEHFERMPLGQDQASALMHEKNIKDFWVKLSQLLGAEKIADLCTTFENDAFIAIDMDDIRRSLESSKNIWVAEMVGRGEHRANAIADHILNGMQPLDNTSAVVMEIVSAEGDAEVDMDEITLISDALQKKLRKGAMIIWGLRTAKSLTNGLQVMLVGGEDE